MGVRRRRGTPSEVSKRHGRDLDHLVFLSPEWVREIARVVETARGSDEYFRRLSSAFSFRVLYMIGRLPPSLQHSYGGKGEARIFVDLVQGQLRKLEVGDCDNDLKADFTVTSDYRTAQRIFRGELSPARAFAERLLRVEPAAHVYRRPGFAAKTLIVAGLVLKHARRVATRFETDGGHSAGA